MALGRRNWLHLGHKSAGPKIAAVISVVETCRRLDIKLRDYLGDDKARSGMSFKLRSEEDAANVWAYLVSLAPES